MAETGPPQPPAEQDASAAPRRRQASAIDGRLPPGVLEALAARTDLDPEAVPGGVEQDAEVSGESA